MPESGMDFGDIPAWIALIISVVTAINQLRVNSQSERNRKASEQSAKRERETERHKLRIEQIMKDVEDLSALSVDYWMRSGGDTGSTGVLINSKVRDLSSRIYRYSSFLWPSAAQDFLIIKQAITGGTFQSAARSAVKETSGTIRAITSSSGSLKDKLRAEFDKLDMPSTY